MTKFLYKKDRSLAASISFTNANIGIIFHNSKRPRAKGPLHITFHSDLPIPRAFHPAGYSLCYPLIWLPRVKNSRFCTRKADS